VTQEADAHVQIDGHRIDPTLLTQTRLAFMPPSGGREIALRSRTFVPAHTVAESRDPRAPGLCGAALPIYGSSVELGRDDAFASGWQEAEFADETFTHRWTTGSTLLPAGACVVIADLAGVGNYWRQTPAELVALRA